MTFPFHQQSSGMVCIFSPYDVLILDRYCKFPFSSIVQVDWFQTQTGFGITAVTSNSTDSAKTISWILVLIRGPVNYVALL